MFIPGGLRRFGDLYSTKVPLRDVHVHFDCASSRKPGRGDLSSEDLVLLARRPRFWAMSILRGRRGAFRAFWSVKHCLAWQRRTSDTFSSAQQAWHFLYIAQTERCYSSWHAQYLVNLDDILNRSKILWNRCRIWFRTWWWFCVAGAALWMRRAHFVWQAQYFVDIVRPG